MDTTTLLALYLETLLPGDQSDELRLYLNGVRLSADSLDDLNTAISLDLR